MIRKARIEDITYILEVIKDAKELLKSKNSLQWQDSDGYPNYQTFLDDVKNEFLYVYEKDNRIVGVCALGTKGEPTYDKIYDGAWLNDEKYNVIHRLAVSKDFYGKGVAKELLLFLEKKTKNDNVQNIRADTTVENAPMNNLLISLGYERCGIIYLNKSSDNNMRVAYHKTLKLS